MRDSTLLVLGLALAAGSAIAGDAGATAATVPLYTNADLERFPQAPETAPAAVAEPGDGWDFVREHLDREYARLDAERAYGLARRDDGGAKDAREVFRLPYFPYAYGDHGGYERSCAPHPLHPSARSGLGAWPLPLHAGPTPTERFRARALATANSR